MVSVGGHLIDLSYDVVRFCGWAARSVASVVATGQPEHDPGQGVYSAAALALERGLARFAT